MGRSRLSLTSTTDIKFDFAMCCSAYPAAQARLMICLLHGNVGVLEGLLNLSLALELPFC